MPNSASAPVPVLVDAPNPAGCVTCLLMVPIIQLLAELLNGAAALCSEHRFENVHTDFPRRAYLLNRVHQHSELRNQDPD
jgi:hypothetical protein